MQVGQVDVGASKGRDGAARRCRQVVQMEGLSVRGVGVGCGQAQRVWRFWTAKMCVWPWIGGRCGWCFGEEGLTELVEGVVGVLLRRRVWVVIVVEVDASGEPSVGGQVGEEECFECVGGEDGEVRGEACCIGVGFKVG